MSHPTATITASRPVASAASLFAETSSSSPITLPWTFQSPVTYQTGSVPLGVGVGDFNGDGGLDIAVADLGHRNSTRISVHLQVTTVALSDTTLNFGVQLVGTRSLTQPITLTNTGPITLNISNITASGDFLQKNNCGTSVPAGGSCTIKVEFKPNAKGLRTGTVTITDDAANSPQTIALAGTGTVVQLSPKSLDFGNQPVGTTSSPKTVTVTNVGAAPLHISGIGITGVNFGDFLVESTTCGSSLPGGASCTISVVFTPKAKGSRQGFLAVADNGGGSPQRVALAGTGT